MSSVEVFPAMNGSDPNITGLTKYSAKRIVCSGKYISSTSYEDDWAIIELDGNPGSRYGWLGLRWRGGSFVGDNIWNTGYPGGKDAPKSQNKYGTVMMLGKGKILDCDGHTLKGAWDATVGNSRGPVFSPYSYGGYDAIGILSTGSGTNTYGQDYGNAYTTATRFTRGMYDLFVRCKNKGISSL